MKDTAFCPVSIWKQNHLCPNESFLIVPTQWLECFTWRQKEKPLHLLLKKAIPQKEAINLMFGFYGNEILGKYWMPIRMYVDMQCLASGVLGSDFSHIKFYNTAALESKVMNHDQRFFSPELGYYACCQILMSIVPHIGFYRYFMRARLSLFIRPYRCKHFTIVRPWSFSMQHSALLLNKKW